MSLFLKMNSPGVKYVEGVDSSSGAIFGPPLGIDEYSTNGGTINMTSLSKNIQLYNGTANESVILPDATSIQPGYQYQLKNDSTGTITVKVFGGTQILTEFSDTSITVTLVASSNTIPSWVTF